MGGEGVQAKFYYAGLGGEKVHACTIEAVLFDFGGVIAEEGFRDGLYAIAGANGLEGRGFAAKARDIIHRTGHVQRTLRIGLKAILFEGRIDFLSTFFRVLP